MNIGIPKEIKTLEGRVSLTPSACHHLVKQGHAVWVEQGAGAGAGFSDDDYRSSGAQISDKATLFARAKLIVKVKEPMADDLAYLRREHVVFCYLHLAADMELAARLSDIGCTAIAFETVEEGGKLPLLAPMSMIAGRLAVFQGAQWLQAQMGGKGKLLGGVPGTVHGHVVVLGGGIAGMNAATLAAAMGAHVTVLDIRPQALSAAAALGPSVTARFAQPSIVAEQVARADIVIGAVLVPGARAPRVLSAEMVSSMERGSVIVDISVDQGGCVETTRPTTYAEPTYVEYGVTHFAVTNMPGAVPRTASEVLSGTILPYVERLTHSNWREHDMLANAINVADGNIVHPELIKLIQ